MADRPTLSFILATPDGYRTVRMTTLHLNRQTIADRIEVVFVTEHRESFSVPAEDVDALHSAQVVESPVVDLLSEARAAGVRASRGKYVALGEDHSFPTAQWAERLVAAHEAGADVAGAALRNPRPDLAQSWADLLVSFCGFVDPVEEGPRPCVAGHNCSYRRELLDCALARLPEILQLEFLYHLKLGTEGCSIQQTGALTDHHQVLGWRIFAAHKWLGGLIYGGMRSRDWSLLKRIAVGGLSLGAPALRLWRMRAELARLNKVHGFLPAAIPQLLAGLMMHGLGEAVGTVFGDLGARKNYWRAEFHRQGAPVG